MAKINKIAVSSPSFCKNFLLVSELKEIFPHSVFNLEAKRLEQAELIDFLGDAEGWLVGSEPVTDEVLSACSKIKIISKYGVGLDNIDFDACRRRGVKVLFSKGVNAQSVAELALGHILNLLHRSYVTSNLLKQGIWQKSGGVELYKKTIGIIGVGHVGQKLINLLQPFECKILVNDLINQENYYQSMNLTPVSKEYLFKHSEIISLHVPLDHTTENMIGEKEFNWMQTSCVLINTSRGKIIDQTALKQALLNKKISGAALDVYDSEPCEDLELLVIPNLINTPHIGGNTQEAVEAMGKAAMGHLVEFFKY